MLTRENIQDICPLSPMQEAMYFHSLLDRSSLAYFEQISFHRSGDMDVRLVEYSFNELFKRYDTLRTVFIQKTTDRPLQIILRERQVDFLFEDIRAAADKQLYIAQFKERDRQRSFDLVKDVLMRVAVLQTGDSDYEIIWSWHHIVMDAWCVSVLQDEFVEIYKCRSEHRDHTLPDVKPYSAYIGWLEKQDKTAAAAFWSKYLANYAGVTGIPDWKQDRTTVYTPGLCECLLDEETSGNLARLAARCRVTVNTVMQALWGILLSKYNGKRDIVFGVIVSGRPPMLEGVESMVGLFINSLPVRINCAPEKRCCDLIRELQAGAVEREPHQYYSLSSILADTGLKQDLFDHLFLFQNFPVSAQEADSGTGGEEDLRLSATGAFQHFFYDLNIFVAAGRLMKVTVKFNRNRWEEELIRGMLGHYSDIVRQVIADSEMLADDIVLEDVAEKQPSPSSAGGPATNDSAGDTITRLFDRQAQAFPDATAVRYGQRTISYSALNEKANGLALYLQQNFRTGPGQVVAVMAGRSEMTAVALLGILKAGAAFLPVDPAYPPERRAFILSDAKAAVLITESQWMFDVTEYYTGAVFAMDIQLPDIAGSDTAPETGSLPEHLAYVLYTSGSTGMPKGVEITMRNFSNYLQWANRFYFNDRRGHTFAFFTPLVFDLTLTSIFTTLLRGDTLLVCEEQDISTTLTHLFRDGVADVIKLTPSHISLLRHLSIERTTVSCIIAGGEALTREHVKILRELNPDIRIFNEYGPTEATIGCIAGEIKGEGPVTIGRPISDTYAYIVDDKGRPAADGFPGEIWIGGACVGAGYAGNEELTRQQFMPDPFRQNGNIYITGDMGRRRPDGAMEYLGRKDDQVKVRGYRIEPGEIVQQLLETGLVDDAVVVARQDKAQVNFLVAYIVSGSGADTDELKARLSRRLPAYMVPDCFVPMEQLPLTSNGKVDKKALPDPLAPQEAREIALPENATEESILNIWKEVLNRDVISIDDKFFGIGGHSLNATQLVSRIYKQLNARIELADIFSFETIRKQAALINNAEKTAYEAITPVGKRPYYELSHAQKRLWIVDQFNNNRHAYNIPETYVFRNLNPVAFERAFQALIERHEILRTTFHYVDGEPCQQVDAYRADYFSIRYTDLRNDPDRDETAAALAAKESSLSFDLSKGPLFRVTLLQIADDRHICLFIMHHIISDGWSTVILVNEFFALYSAFCREKAHSLPALKIQYKDFAHWQNRKDFSAAEAYWLEKLAGKGSLVNLPLSNKAGTAEYTEGDIYVFEVGGEVAAALRQVANRYNTTLSNIVLSIYFLLMKQVSDQDDICIGMAHANRDHPDVEGLIGFFVNILVIRVRFDDDTELDGLIRQVVNNTLEGLKYAYYPFELLVEKLCKERYAVRNPLVNVTYSFQNFQDVNVGLENAAGGDTEDDHNELEFSFYQHGRQTKTSKSDLHLIVAEHNDGLRFRFEHTALLQRASMQQLAGTMRNLLLKAGHAGLTHKNSAHHEVI